MKSCKMMSYCCRVNVGGAYCHGIIRRQRSPPAEVSYRLTQPTQPTQPTKPPPCVFALPGGQL